MTGSLWINQIIWKNNFLPLAINTKRTTGTFLNAHIPIFLLYLIDSNSNYTIFIKSTWWICNGSNYCGRAYYWFISPGQWMIRYSCTHHLFRNFFLNRRILAGINFLMDVLQFLGHLKWQLTVKGNVNGTIVYSQVIQIIWHTILEIRQLCNHNPHGPIQQNQEISVLQHQVQALLLHCMQTDPLLQHVAISITLDQILCWPNQLICHWLTSTITQVNSYLCCSSKSLPSHTGHLTFLG